MTSSTYGSICALVLVLIIHLAVSQKEKVSYMGSENVELRWSVRNADIKPLTKSGQFISSSYGTQYQDMWWTLRFYPEGHDNSTEGYSDITLTLDIYNPPSTVWKLRAEGNMTIIGPNKVSASTSFMCEYREWGEGCLISNITESSEMRDSENNNTRYSIIADFVIPQKYIERVVTPEDCEPFCYLFMPVQVTVEGKAESSEKPSEQSEKPSEKSFFEKVMEIISSGTGLFTSIVP